MKEYWFVSQTDGALYDTRRPDWASSPVRPVYQRHFHRIETTQQLKATLRAGAYAWPGGYPLALITSDGALLCFDCARENLYQIVWSMRHECSDGWRVVGCDTVYHDEENSPICDHCGREIG